MLVRDYSLVISEHCALDHLYQIHAGSEFAASIPHTIARNFKFPKVKLYVVHSVLNFFVDF